MLCSPTSVKDSRRRNNGQQVEEGDLLIILEAMKMENEIIAEQDGVIGQLLVAEGDAVEIGQPLLTLD